jgi:hypothetical protein
MMACHLCFQVGEPAVYFPSGHVIQLINKEAAKAIGEVTGMQEEGGPGLVMPGAFGGRGQSRGGFYADA